MGPALLAVGALLALATLVSEDLTSIGAGLLVADGRLPFAAASVACFIGIFVGDLLLFGAGRWLGRPILRRPPLRWWLDEEAVAKSSAWFERRGGVVVLISRFTPGTRLATYFTAGLLHTSFWRFALYMALAVGLWTPLLVLVARVAGSTALDRIGALHANLLLMLVLALALFVVIHRLVLPLFSWRGRRGLVGAWRRWTRWEFWPPWLFYPPVLAYVCWLGLRHRGLTVFTAANPGFPAGGFIGESKAEILAALDRALERDQRGSPPIQVPAWRLVEAGPLEERVRAVRALIEEEGIAFPIVLKPDVGQRGQGVESVLDEAAAARWLERQPAPRDRAALRRRAASSASSTTECRVRSGDGSSRSPRRISPVVVGDGRSTLEELVLADRRAVAIARVYRAELGSRGVTSSPPPASACS